MTDITARRMAEDLLLVASCAVTRQTGLRGAKPDQFNRWVLDLMAFQDGDTLDDIFPGTSGMAATLTRPPFEFGETA